jgi:glycosyltransferase involved in cell wall biosynthesis
VGDKEKSALPESAWRKLQSLGNMDIVVGIPSFNCAHTINYVIYQTARGLAKYFPDKKSVILVSDGGSSDGTLEVVKAIKLPWDVTVIPSEYVGVSGKGTALKAVFETMKTVEAEALMMVDSDLRSIQPEWVNLFLSSIFKGAGLVTPYYTRHKYDGTITNFLCYPFTRALWGKMIRQPIGGDFALSQRLVDNLLASRLWRTPYVPRFGIDIFITHTALNEGLTLKQAFLGSKVHEAKDPSKHLASMFHEVAGAMFSCTEINEDIWRGIQESKPVELIKGSITPTPPEEIQVDFKKLLHLYSNNFNMFATLFKEVIGFDLYRNLEILSMKKDHFVFPDDYWSQCVYSFAAAFKNELDFNKRKELLEALRVLWMGKFASFVIETVEDDTAEAEAKIEEECVAFEKFKPYLLSAY